MVSNKVIVDFFKYKKNITVKKIYSTYIYYNDNYITYNISVKFYSGDSGILQSEEFAINLLDLLDFVYQEQ